MAMMENVKEIVNLPEGVTATVEIGLLTLTGSKGSTSKRLLHPRVVMSVSENGVEFLAVKFGKNEKKLMKTFAAHVNNLIKGVEWWLIK